MTIHALGRFRLDTRNDLLFRGIERVALGHRAVALLRALVEHSGRVVSKDALIEAAWPGQAVEESNLSVQIAALRRVLQEEPGGDRWIETMPRRGYRFVGPVVVEVQKDAAAAPPQAAAAPGVKGAQHNEAERRQITALCCELVGSAAGADGSGLEELRETVALWHRRLAEIAGRHGGHVASGLGNAVLVLFGWPAAHENDAERAVRAGLELSTAFESMLPGADRPVRCRVGIATGMAILPDPARANGLDGHAIIGNATDFALQLQLSVPPDTVAIGPATRRLIGNLFDCRELGAIDANSGGAPLRRWQVLAESAIESRFEALHPAPLTALVGREEEIEFLLRRWRQAKNGEGQVVLLGGEPGIGKSRIAAVLLEKLQGEPHTRLRCFCSPHHADSALYPAIAQLEHAAGFIREDSAADKREKLHELLAQTGTTPEEAALFADLLSLPAGDVGSPIDGLTPQQKKERTFAALVRQLETLGRRQPLLMLFEDAHWADPSSGELLDRVVERIPQLPVLLVVTFRPEYYPPWSGQPNVAALMLGRLGRREAALLAERAAGGKTLPKEVVDRVVERTDGVPLYVEELTKSLLESGLLREEAGRWVLDRALPPLAIPASLNDSLTARLDRAATARRVAQIGAAIGGWFPYALLRAVCGLSEDELQEALARLVASELVFQRGTPPDAVYSFKHALVRDAAYGSLLRAARRELHAQVAEALETQFPEMTDTQPEQLAQHYAEAGLGEKSIAYWAKAGHRSASRSAMAEAATQFQRALDQLRLLPANLARSREELELLCALGGVLLAVKGMAAPEMHATFARARELWEQLGYPSEFLQIPYGQSRYHAYRGELDLALHIDEDLIRLSRERADTAGLIMGYGSSGRTLMLLGKFYSSYSRLEKALALFIPNYYRTLVDQTGFHLDVMLRGYLGIVLFCRGFPEQALIQAKLAIVEARQLAHPPSLAATLAACVLVASQGDDDSVLGEWADQLVTIATDHGFPLWQALGTVFRAWALVRNGGVVEGMSLLRSALSAFRGTGAEGLMTCFIGLVARACEIAGQPEEALASLDDALQIVERTGAYWFAAELTQLKGQLQLQHGNTEAAEKLYCKALGIAQEQEAKLWELRAAVSLARLRRDQGRRAEARDLLAPVYGWFTEGFATPDLVEAKALLDQLG